ncbi:MAG: fumarate hydratase [Thermoanaerobaculaceae bacterium]|nr:fumarate hydratase [Thermoanaerobaculaceae bacterium]
MRTIKGAEITEAVAKLAIEKAYKIGDEILRGFEWSLENEKSEAGREIIRQLQENAKIAADGVVPYCQDTGMAVFFVEVGQDLKIDGDLEESIQEGIRRGYIDGYLRKSVYKDPLRRVNTSDNTPAIIHYQIVKGDKLKITFGAKGGGSENMSRLAMLKPSDGIEGVKNFVIETVSIGGANACPPLVLGVGIGGNFEKCAILAKKAALRSLEVRNPDPFYAELEEELKEKCNALGIGPMGLGGTVTVLGVNIEVFACHLVALPVAVNINCHAARHGEIIL